MRTFVDGWIIIQGPDVENLEWAGCMSTLHNMCALISYQGYDIVLENAPHYTLHIKFYQNMSD